MVDYNYSDEEDTTKMAIGCFLSIYSAVVGKNIEKTAIAFYDIIKKTYGLAELEGLFEKDKKKIDSALKTIQALMIMGLETEEWSDEMIEEFNSRVKELWVIN